MDSNIEKGIQSHAGLGNNIGRDQIINISQRLAPESLQKPIEKIISNIREKRHEIAKAQFEIIREGLLDDSSGAILDILSLHLNLVDETQQPPAKAGGLVR